MHTIADWNRSEPLTSAALGLLLKEPSLGAPLLRKVAVDWVMWRKGESIAACEAFDLGEGELDATALLHFRRDQRARSGKGAGASPNSERTAFREVDVVAWTSRVVLGIEVKVLSPRSPSKLSTQMAEQREELVAFADAAGCSHIAQCVLVPLRVAGLEEGINQLSFGALAAAAEALSADRRTASDLLDAVLRQLARADTITKHLHPNGYTTVTTRKLRAFAPSCFVGVDGLTSRGELDAQLVRARSKWKVTEHDYSSRPNWRRLDDVLRALDGATRAG